MQEIALQDVELGDRAKTLRLVTYNVQCGIGADKSYDPQRAARWIAEQDPDVVCLQEVESSNGPTRHMHMGVEHADDQPGIAAEALGWKDPEQRHFVVKQLSERVEVDGKEKWIRKAPGEDDAHGWGIAVLSHHPISTKGTVRIPEQSSPWMCRLPSQAAGCRVELPQLGATWIFSAHLMADKLGALTWDFFGSLQLENLEAILRHIEEVADPATTDSVLLAGDLNTFFGSGTTRRLLTCGGS